MAAAQMMTPQTSPAAARESRVTEASRRPLTLPSLTLEVPEIPGYYLYWFLGHQVDRAQEAGYEFVDNDEVTLNNKRVGDSVETSGSSDMGTRVSVAAGGLIKGTAEPQRMYLMKLRQEWREKDLADLEKRNESIAASLRGGMNPSNVNGAAPNETGEDRLKRYLKQGQDLFIRKPRKG